MILKNIVHKLSNFINVFIIITFDYLYIRHIGTFVTINTS